MRTKILVHVGGLRDDLLGLQVLHLLSPHFSAARRRITFPVLDHHALLVNVTVVETLASREHRRLRFLVEMADVPNIDLEYVFRNSVFQDLNFQV